MKTATSLMSVVLILGFAIPARADHDTERIQTGTVLREGSGYFFQEEGRFEKRLILNPTFDVRQLAFHRVEALVRDGACGVELYSIREARRTCEVVPVAPRARDVIVQTVPTPPVMQVQDCAPDFSFRLGRRAVRVYADVRPGECRTDFWKSAPARRVTYVIP